MQRGLLGRSGSLSHADKQCNNEHHNQHGNCQDRYSLARVPVAYNHQFDLKCRFLNYQVRRLGAKRITSRLCDESRSGDFQVRYTAFRSVSTLSEPRFTAD